MIVLSVRHTGSHFLNDALGLSGYFIHSGIKREIVDKWLGGHDVIVSPLRDPKDVWASFCKRDHPEELFWKDWNALIDLNKQYKIHYVPIDHPERDACFSAISDEVVDWDKRLGAIKNVTGEFRKIDLSPIYKIPFVSQFYG